MRSDPFCSFPLLFFLLFFEAPKAMSEDPEILKTLDYGRPEQRRKTPQWLWWVFAFLGVGICVLVGDALENWRIRRQPPDPVTPRQWPAPQSTRGAG